MITHELKTDPEVFEAVARGLKTHEIRLNDRGFAVGDTLVLRETMASGADMRFSPKAYPLIYTGRTETRTVSHIQTGYGLADDWCILSFAAKAAPTDAKADEAERIRATLDELGYDDHDAVAALFDLASKATTAQSVRDALEQAARICADADKSTHPSELADRIRALIQSPQPGEA